MQRHTISKSALLHQANVLCCTITKIIEDCTGREPNGLISTCLWLTCQSEGDMTSFEADDAWFEQWPDFLLISNLAERASGFKQIILREGPIKHCNLTYAFIMSSIHPVAFTVTKILLLFFMTNRLKIKTVEILEFPTQKASC